MFFKDRLLNLRKIAVLHKVAAGKLPLIVTMWLCVKLPTSFLYNFLCETTSLPLRVPACVLAFKNGQQFPLVYCLLPNKARDTYQRTLELLKKKAEELHLDLSPSVVLSDFELAIIQAAELSFPTADIKGCYYHYCQCLNRNVQNLGLQVAYREDHHLNSFIRKTAALAFVPWRYEIGMAGCKG